MIYSRIPLSSILWDGHGGSSNPGTFWRCGNLRAFTPAPFNTRRIAWEFLKSGCKPKEYTYTAPDGARWTVNPLLIES